MRTCVLVLSAGLIVAFAQLAHAQEAQVTAQQAGELEEVIVTAQRRSENLQRAAVPVSVLTGDALVNAGVTQVTELTTLVPALQVSNAAGPYSLFYLRGVGSFNGNSLSDAAVALNYDGVFVARPSSSNGMFYDLERVEVLKGPQGTLYGRNATGGAINVIPRRPDFELGGDLTATVADYDHLQSSGALNVPFSANSAARLAFQTVEHDGYMSDGTSDADGQAARLQFRFDPSDSLSIVVGGDYYQEGGHGPGAALIPFIDDDARIGLEDPRTGAVYASTLIFSAGDFLEPLPTGLEMDNDFWGVNATINWTTSAGTLTVIPAYRQANLDYQSTEATFLIIQQEKDEQTSLEVRFASPAEQQVSWLIGGYWLSEDIEVPSANFNQQFNASYQDFRPSTDSWAAFGSLTLTLADAFRLTGGVRYTSDDKSFEGNFFSAQVICPGAFIPPPAGPQFCFGGQPLPNSTVRPTPGPAQGGQVIVTREFTNDDSNTWEKTTWRAAAEWDIAPESMIYLSVETGFKAGGFFFTTDDPTYDPEEITAYTLGSKNRFLENRIQLNAELFYWDYTDQQISHITRDSVGNVVFATENVGDATMKGVELESLFLVTENTLLQADVQYLDAKYDQFVYTVPNFGAPPVASCPATPAGPVFNVDCSGKTAPQAPEWTVNLGVQQTFPLGASALVAQVDAHYQTETMTGLEFLPAEEQGAYWWVSASVAFNADHWSIVGYIDNIGDEEVINATFLQPLAGTALIGGSLRPPQTYGLRLTAQF